MPLEFIDHYSIRVRSADLAPVARFYTDVLGLKDGDRPPFSFPGNWLYAAGKPVVHLIGIDTDPALAETGETSGRFDHVSFRCSDLPGMRAHLASLGIRCDERPVPGTRLYQLFLRDPAGVLVELTFET